MNKKNEDLFDKWIKNARAKIEAFHSYTDEDQLRNGIVEVSSLLSEILDKQYEMCILKERAKERESVLVEKFNSLINSRYYQVDDYEVKNEPFVGNIDMP